jgi:macrolide transport system ATP-binding/permease protein
MSWLARFRLRHHPPHHADNAWRGPRSRDREIAEEIDTHLAMATRDRIERGETPEEARLAVLREFGNVALIRESTRHVWSWTRLEQLLQDLRFGARILWHSPALSAMAVFLAALVIGGNTTIYSMVRSVLTSLPAGVTADRLVAIKQVDPAAMLADPFFSYPSYRDYAAGARTLRGLVAWSDERLTIGVDTGNYAVFGGLVTPNYFDILGVGLSAGRAFRPADDTLHNGLVVVISDRLWRDRFQQTADIVGRSMLVNGNPATIVGVAAPGFLGPILTAGEDVWVPIEAYYAAIADTGVLNNPAQRVVVMVGQLAPGASLRQARAELATLWAQTPVASPTDRAKTTVVATNFSATALLPVADIAPRFLTLFSVVTLLTLLIVSANVANLLLGRAVERQRDTAVRQSLGASRIRIVRMLLAEGVAIAMTAWVAASVLAWWTSRALARFVEPRSGLLPDMRPDWSTAAYAMLLALLAMLAFTTAPGVRAWRQQALPLLKSGEHGVARGRSRLSSTLVVLQFAFSVLLLTSAGLAYRSLSLFDSGDVGFETDNLLLVTVRAVRSGAFAQSEPSAAEREMALGLLERVRERLTGVAHLESVTYSRRVPGPYLLTTTAVRRESRAEPAHAYVRPVGPDYLKTLGVSPAMGRELTTIDQRGAVRTAVINRQLATQLWPQGSPIGETLLLGDEPQPVEIVGVAPDALFDGPVHEPRPRYVLIAEQQRAGRPPIDPTFFIRHRSSLEAVTPLVGRAIAEVDAALPIVAMTTMRQRIESVSILERQVATLLTWFSAMSLVIAALGQYAVAMFNMRRRTRDFGVRMALGASSRQIQHGVVNESLRLTTAGLVLGFALSAAAASAFRSVLFGVTPTDPPTYAGVLLVLAMTSLVASYLPAWRAGRVNVVDALRQE